MHTNSSSLNQFGVMDVESRVKILFKKQPFGSTLIIDIFTFPFSSSPSHLVGVVSIHPFIGL
jgi:hypothetical protein